MKKIILAGLSTDRNLGDIVIADCAKFLFNEETKKISDVEYGNLDLTGYYKSIAKKPFLLRKMYGAWNRLVNLFITNKMKRQVLQHSKYYQRHIKNASLIVIVGGGMIKYKYQHFWLYLSGLIDAAERVGVPIVLNALGVEGYNENDPRCQILKRALNNPAVKVITTRDDIDTLQKCYLRGNRQVISRKVADPAVYAADAYNVQQSKNLGCVGVGLIRGNIFKDNEVTLSKEDVAMLYINILTELDSRGIAWKVFTNGLPADLELAHEIFTAIGKSNEVDNILVPQTAKQLLEIIAGFNAVIAARLHACIISYSLNIPAVGLVWNDKLLLFGESIGHPERFITSDKFDKAYIVNQLEKAQEEGFNMENVEAYNQTIKDSIKEILHINHII